MLAALYRRTEYAVAAPDGTAILRVGAPPPRAIADWIGARGSAVFLSACNPYSQPLADAENRVRDARLRERLRRDGADFLDGEGSIPGSPWREPGVLIAGAPAYADALAREFDQNASVGVAADGVRLRLYRADWRDALGDADDVDWV